VHCKRVTVDVDDADEGREEWMDECQPPPLPFL
jgi:hypothetical protein